MIGLRTVLLLFVSVLTTAIIVFASGFTLAFIERFRVWIWRMIASPSMPPWMQNHFAPNRVYTAEQNRSSKNTIFDFNNM